MEYNKNQFQKINDKKLLRKIGKRWAVVSAFLLFAIGGSISELTPNAHADDSTNRTKAQLNQNNSRKQTIQKTNQVHQNINTQAKTLHAQILNNNLQNRVHNYINSVNNQFNQHKQNNDITSIHNQSIKTTNNSTHNPILINKQNNSNQNSQNNLTTTKQINEKPIGNSNDNGYIDNRGYYHAPASDFHRTAQYDYNSSTQTLTIHDGTLISSGARTPYWTPYVNNYGTVKHIDLERAVAPSDSHSLFDYNPNLQSVVGYMDTSQANNINYLFLSDIALSDISALSHWNTHHVVNMQKAFGVNSNIARGCQSLKNLDAIKNWDVSNVQNMDNMFSNCTSLTNINGIRNWYTPNLNQASYMFDDDYNLTNVDLSNWVIDKSGPMNAMFGSDGNLVYINLGSNTHFDYDSAPAGRDIGPTDTRNINITLADDCAGHGWKSVAGANKGQIVNNNDSNGGDRLAPNNTWINLKNAVPSAPLNFTWHNPITNQNINGTNDSINGFDGMKISANDYVPVGYKLDPTQNYNSNQINYTLNNNTQNITLNVIPNNVKTYGHWGSAHWTLDYSNDLDISDGMLTHQGNHLVNNESASIPQSIQEETQHINVNNVSFQQVSDNTKEADLNGLFNNAASDAINASWSGGTPIQLHYKNLESCNFSNISGVPIAVFKMMFVGDRKLKTVNGLNHLNISWNNGYQGGSPDFSGMFWDCSSLSDVTFNGGQTAQPWWLGHMFQSDTNLKSIDLSEFDTSDTATKHYGTSANYTFGSLIQNDPNIVYVKLGQKAKILNGGATNMGQPANVTNQIDAPNGWKSIQGNNEGMLVKDGNLLPGNTWINVKNATEAAPLNISFQDQNNNSIGTPQVFKGYIGQNVNISNIIPSGYQMMPGQKTNYTLTNQTQNAVVKVNVKTVAQGYWGQCKWTLDSFGDLSIDGNENSNNMQTASHPSQLNQNDSGIQFAPSVQKNGSLWNDITTLNFHNAVAPTTNYGQCPTLFGEMQNLTTVNHGLNVSNMHSMWNQFVSDPKLSNINGLSDWDVSHTTQMVYMFEGTPSLHDVSSLRHWNFADNDGIGGMFKNSGIDSFDLPNLHFTYDMPNSDGGGQTGHIDNVFSSDYNLKSIDISGLSLKNYYTIANFINNDHNLLFVKLGIFNLKPVGTDPDADGKGSNLGSSVQDVIQADATKNGTNYGWKSIAGNNVNDVVKNGQLLGHNTWINLANAKQAAPLNLSYIDQNNVQIKSTQVNGYVGMSINVNDLTPAGYQIAPGQKTNYTLSNQTQNATVKVNTKMVAQGLWGQCHWYLDSLGNLDIVGNGNQNNMQTANHPLAMDGNDSNVQFAPNVKKNGSLWRDIKTLNFKNAVAPGYMGNMFQGMSDLTTINKGLDTSNVTWVHETFQSDKKLTNINGLADWNIKNINNLSWLFQSDLSLADVSPISHWSDHNPGLTMGRLFDNCPSLVNVDIPHFNITAGNNWDDYEFAGDTSLKNLDLSGWDNHLTTDTDSFLAGDKNLVFIKLNPNFIPDARGIQTGEPFSKDASQDAIKNGTNYGWKSIAGKNVGTVVKNGQLLGGNTWINLANAVQAQPLTLNFKDQYGNKIGNPQKVNGYVGQKVNVSNLAPTGYQIAPSQQLNYTLSNQPQSVNIQVNVSTVAQGLWGQCHWLVDGLGDLDITGIGNQNNMQTANHPSAIDGTDNNAQFAPNVKKNGSLWKDINTINFNNAVAPQNAGDIFANMPDLIKVNSGLNTGNTTYIGNAFSDDPELNDINGLSNWDVSHITGFGHIFAGDTSLTNFNMPNWQVGKNTTATNLDNLFTGDTALKSVNLSGFNIKNSILDNIFGGATSYSPEKFNNYKLVNSLTYMKLGPNFNIAQSGNDNSGSGTPIKQDLTEIAPQGWESIAGNNVGDIVTDGNVLPNNTWLNIKNAPTAQPLNFTWHNTKNGQNVKGANDTVNGNLGQKVNAINNLPKGYILDPSSHYNSNQTNFMLSNNTQNITLNIIPITKIDDIQFELSGSNIPANNAGPIGIIASDKTDYSGNDSSDANTQDTNYTFTNNATNLKGMPAHYHIVGNQTINYDGGVHKVEIAPDTVTDIVNYIYKGHGNTIYNSFHPQGIYNTHNTINWDNYGYNQMPTNWNISNDGTQNWVFNGGSHNVNVQPNSVSDTIYYQYNGVTKGQHTFYGNESGAQGASDTSFVIGNNPAGLPNGYHIVHPKQSIPFNYAGKYDVAIAPNYVTQHINYQWFNRSVGSTNINGYYDNTGTINGAGLNAGWHVNKKATYGDTDGNYHFTFNGHTTTIGVLPNTVTDHIHYVGKGISKWQNINGNDYRTGVNGSFLVSNNLTGLPIHYHVINPNQSINYDGGNHDVQIARNTDNINVHYINQNNQKVGSDSVNSMNDVITWPTTAPKGYFIDGGQETKHTIQASDLDNNNNLAKGDFNTDGSHDIYVTGNKAKLNLQFVDKTNGVQLIDSDDFNGTNSIGDKITKISIPRAYHLDSDYQRGSLRLPAGYQIDPDGKDLDYTFNPNNITSDNVINRQDVDTMSSKPIQVRGNLATVHVNYIDSNDNVIEQRNVVGNIGKHINLSSVDNPHYVVDDNSELQYVFSLANIQQQQQNNDDSELMNTYTIYVHRRNQYGAHLKVKYINQNGQQVGYTDVIKGNVGDTVDVTNQNDGGETKPTNYEFDNNVKKIYTLQNGISTVYLHLKGNMVKPLITINEVKINNDGSQQIVSQPIQIKAPVMNGNVITLYAKNYTPNNYQPDSNHLDTAQVQVNNSSTNPRTITFYYCSQLTKGAPINVHYVNQDGKVVKTISLLGNQGTKLNEQVVNNNVPIGYSQSSSAIGDIKFSNVTQNINVKINGNQITQTFIVHKIIQKYNSDNQIQTSDQKITLSGNVGDSVLITPYQIQLNKQLPTPLITGDYHSQNQNASLRVQFSANGGLTPLSDITYLYQQNFKNTVGTIKVHYVTVDNNNRINHEIDEESDNNVANQPFNIAPYLEDIPNNISNKNYDLVDTNYLKNNIIQGNGITRFTNGIQNIYIKVHPLGNQQEIVL